MKYTKATNYALHIMAYLVNHCTDENMSLQPLAEKMNLSPTYLSKILTQLVKADLIQSSPGVKGGYSLMKNPKDISFYDVITAIEGSGALFSCQMDHGEGCRIQKVMASAENHMETYLKAQKLIDLHD